MEDISMIGPEEALRRLVEIGRESNPAAPEAQHAAFANAVFYAVVGHPISMGGPTMRDCWAERMILKAGMPGEIPYALAVTIAAGAAYGPVTIEMASMLRQNECFGDTPEDLERALAIFQSHPKAHRHW